MGNSHKHANSKDSEVTLGMYDSLDKGEKGGMGSYISEVRTGEEAGTHLAGKLLLGNALAKLTGPGLKPYLPDLIQIWLLRRASQDSLPGAAFLSEPLGQEAGRATGSF